MTTYFLIRPTMQEPAFYEQDGKSRFVHQVWQWRGEQYALHVYITLETESGWRVKHFASTYRALRRSDLNQALLAAGFRDILGWSRARRCFINPSSLRQRAEREGWVTTLEVNKYHPRFPGRAPQVRLSVHGYSISKLVEGLNFRPVQIGLKAALVSATGFSWQRPSHLFVILSGARHRSIACAIRVPRSTGPERAILIMAESSWPPSSDLVIPELPGMVAESAFLMAHGLQGRPVGGSAKCGLRWLRSSERHGYRTHPGPSTPLPPSSCVTR